MRVVDGDRRSVAFAFMRALKVQQKAVVGGANDVGQVRASRGRAENIPNTLPQLLRSHLQMQHATENALGLKTQMPEV